MGLNEAPSLSVHPNREMISFIPNSVLQRHGCRCPWVTLGDTSGRDLLEVQPGARASLLTWHGSLGLEFDLSFIDQREGATWRPREVVRCMHKEH